MSGAFPRRVSAPNGRRRTRRPYGHADLGSGLRAFKGRIVRVNNRSPAASQPTNPGDDLLEEVRKSLKRLKILEGLKADRDPILTPITTPDDDPPEPSAPEKEDYGSHVARPSKVFATLLVTLVVASSVGWVLSHPGTVPRNAFDVLGPRWKDESATHFTFAASADFGGPDNIDSMALAVRARTAGISFLLALGAGNSDELPQELEDFVLNGTNAASDALPTGDWNSSRQASNEVAVEASISQRDNSSGSFNVRRAAARSSEGAI